SRLAPARGGRRSARDRGSALTADARKRICRPIAKNARRSPGSALSETVAAAEQEGYRHRCQGSEQTLRIIPGGEEFPTRNSERRDLRPARRQRRRKNHFDKNHLRTDRSDFRQCHIAG